MTTDTIYSRTIDSPIGELTLLATDDGLRGVLWPDEERDADDVTIATFDVVGDTVDVVEAPAGGHPVLDDAASQLSEYFAGERRAFDVRLDPVGTTFQRAAWAALCEIPYGETVTYGDQAARLGDRRKARAVGAANGKNPTPIIVPCHRVVGSDGSLTGFAGGTDIKAWLLDHERQHAGVTLGFD